MPCSQLCRRASQIAATSAKRTPCTTGTAGCDVPSAICATRNAAAGGKSSFVQTGAELLAGKGFVIDDLPVFGYKLKEGVDDAVTARSLLEGKLDDSDSEDEGIAGKAVSTAATSERRKGTMR